MAEEYILARDIIYDHSKRMLNIKKYYPYFKLTDNAFTGFAGGKYSGLDMGYILMAVLRFFIEENNFNEKDITYQEYEEFLHDVYRRDFRIPLDEEEEKEVSAYIFDKITNGGKPFSYEYFDPVDRTKKTIRMKLIDSRIRNEVINYFITSEAIEFYLDTKEIKDESGISIAQVLLSKMITTKNYKGGIDVIKRINSEVARLKIRKNEVLAILSEDVFEGTKAYEEFMSTGMRWFEDEQKLFAKNMELIEAALVKTESDEQYFSAVDDIYLLETELKRAIIKHSELLSACTDLQVKADEIITKAKFNRLKPSFDFTYALKKIMERDETDLLSMLVVPLFKLNVKKSFNLTCIDKMLLAKPKNEEEAEKISETTEEVMYVYEDEIEEERIENNYHVFIRELLDFLLQVEEASLSDFNEILKEKYSGSIFTNGDYYSFLVHMSQKKYYDIDMVVEKPDTFFEEFLKDVVIKDEDDKYSGIILTLEFNEENILKLKEDFEISDIYFRLKLIGDEDAG